MKQKKTQFPAEEVTLPSKGLLYPEDSPLRKGIIEMKYMTAREEDILTNPNLINNGTVIDKLLESLIVTPINYNELLTGDKDAVLVAARVLGYGSDYTFEYRGEKITIDLNNIEDKPLDESLVIEGKNEFTFTLPTSKKEVTGNPIQYRIMGIEDQGEGTFNIAAALYNDKKYDKNEKKIDLKRATSSEQRAYMSKSDLK